VALVISDGVMKKLQGKVPPVTRREVEQCFENREGGLLRDTREKNRTDPPTMWFVAPTNSNRSLKVVFIQSESNVILKTAYDPNEDERRIYEKYAG
jgi:hypothetical protein